MPEPVALSAVLYAWMDRHDAKMQPALQELSDYLVVTFGGPPLDDAERIELATELPTMGWALLAAQVLNSRGVETRPPTERLIRGAYALARERHHRRPLTFACLECHDIGVVTSVLGSKMAQPGAQDPDGLRPQHIGCALPCANCRPIERQRFARGCYNPGHECDEDCPGK